MNFLINKIERDGGEQLVYIFDFSETYNKNKSTVTFFIDYLQSQGIEFLEAQKNNEYQKIFQIETYALIAYIKKHQQDDYDHSNNHQNGVTSLEAFNIVKNYFYHTNKQYIMLNWNCQTNIDFICNWKKQLEETISWEMATQIFPELKDLSEVNLELDHILDIKQKNLQFSQCFCFKYCQPKRVELEKGLVQKYEEELRGYKDLVKSIYEENPYSNLLNGFYNFAINKVQQILDFSFLNKQNEADQIEDKPVLLAFKQGVIEIIKKNSKDTDEWIKNPYKLNNSKNVLNILENLLSNQNQQQQQQLQQEQQQQQQQPQLQQIEQQQQHQYQKQLQQQQNQSQGDQDEIKREEDIGNVKQEESDLHQI